MALRGFLALMLAPLAKLALFPGFARHQAVNAFAFAAGNGWNRNEQVAGNSKLTQRALVIRGRQLQHHLRAGLKKRILAHTLHRLAREPVGTGNCRHAHLDDASLWLPVMEHDASDQLIVLGVHHTDRLALAEATITTRRNHPRNEMRDELVVAIDVVNHSSPTPPPSPPGPEPSPPGPVPSPLGPEPSSPLGPPSVE